MRVLGILLIAAALAACQSPEERLAEHRARAEAYLEAEQLDEAKIELLNILQLDPDDADAHFDLGDTLWKLHDFAEARWQFREATRLDPQDVERRVRLAQVEGAFGRHEDALAQIEEAVKLDPKHVEARLIHGTLRFRKGDAEGLLDDIDIVLELEPENVHALRLKGRAHEALQQPSAAEASYRRMIGIKDDTLSRHLYAVFLGTQGRYDDARENYIKAVENASDVEERTQARIALANFHLNMRDIEATEEVLLAARDDNSEDTELLLQLARFYAGIGKADEARGMLELRVQSAEDPVPAYLILADFHRQQGAHDEALAAVESALEVQPGSELARLRKSEYLMDRADTDPTLAKEARDLLAEVMEENPNSVRGMFTEAKYLLLDGRAAEAVPKLRRVVEEQPNSNVYLLLGQAYLTLRQFELARSELLRAVQLDANNVAARARLSALYLQMGERQLAIQEAQEALARNPHDIRVKMVLAEGLAGEGRRDEALALLQNLEVEGGPTLSTDLKFHAARLLRMLAAYDEAHAMLDDVAKARPGDPDVVVEQALIDLFAQDLAAALERLEKAIAANPTEARLYELRGRVRMGITRGGKLVFADEAEADFKQSIELNPAQADAYLQLAQLYQRTGRLDEAIASYEKAAASESGNAGLQVVLGTLYEQVGRYEDAIRVYEMATRIDPSQAIAKNNLAWLLAEHAGNDEATLDRALSLAQDAKERLPQNPFVADTLGWVLLKKQVPNAAISLFKEAIEGYRIGDPNRSVVRFHLAQAYESTGDKALAIAELEKALSEADAFPDRSKAESLLKDLQAG
jgi:tetratricopeptide (TPR) repeat protein